MCVCVLGGHDKQFSVSSDVQSCDAPGAVQMLTDANRQFIMAVCLFMLCAWSLDTCSCLHKTLRVLAFMAHYGDSVFNSSSLCNSAVCLHKGGVM